MIHFGPQQVLVRKLSPTNFLPQLGDQAELAQSDLKVLPRYEDIRVFEIQETVKSENEEHSPTIVGATSLMACQSGCNKPQRSRKDTQGQ